MITIRNVAERAGVSIATVSYVLNGSRRVSPPVAERVRVAAAALRYTPSNTARKLKQRRTAVVGFIADNIANRFPSRLAHGLTTAAAAARYHVLIADLQDSPAHEARTVELLLEEEVDGIIYCGFGAAEHRLAEIHRSGRPVVCVDKPPAARGLPSVLIDNAHGTRLALEHLHDLGHRDLRFISGDPQNRNTALRNEAFRAFLRRRRLRRAGVDILTGAYTLRHGYQAALRLLEEQPGFTAVFCGDDMIAFGAMAAFKSRGLRIPEDVAVAGFSNDPLSGVVDPGLTTVHYPMEEMGRRAFALFLRLRETGDRSSPREELSTRLMVRRSTDPSAAPFAPEDLMEPSTPPRSTP